jgi:hypothetical protein
MRVPEWTVELPSGVFYAQAMDAVEFTIRREDHGHFAALVDFRDGSMGQGLGWLSLDAYDPVTERRRGTDVGMEWLIRVTELIGPPVGKLARPVPCAVLREDARHGMIRGFGLLGSDDDPPLLVADVFPR